MEIFGIYDFQDFVYCLDMFMVLAGFGVREMFKTLPDASLLRSDKIAAHIDPWRPKIHRSLEFCVIYL